MMHVFHLAYRYMAYYRLRTLLLVAAVTLTLMLPIATRWTIERFRAQALERAEATPMVIGAKGSSFGLALHALYFRGDAPITIKASQRRRIDALKLGETLPMLARFRAQGHLVVGTTNDYLAFRNLTLADGDSLERWGDCLVGWQVAQTLGVKPGDRLLSEPENMLDLSGPAPLKMRVRGILSRTGLADDEVIFCHLETAWIMAGIGHGHELPSGSEVSTATSSAVSAAMHTTEGLQRYSEITAENIGSFHFHGNQDDYPLTAIIAIPDSPRSATLLEGKFLSPDEPCQVIIPSEIVSDLLQLVARVQQLLDAVSLLLGVATLLLIVLVMWLSLRLRAAEMRTLQLLGAGRWKIAQIMLAELAMIAIASLLAALGLSSLLVYNLDLLSYW